MGVTIIITKSHGEDLPGTGPQIERGEWLALIVCDSELTIRERPHEITNPNTGEVIRVPAGDAETELRTVDGIVPFLAFRGGDLVMRYEERFDSPNDPVRCKLGAIAREVGAVITDDAGDRILRW